MEAKGHLPFDNDRASEWLFELDGESDLKLLRRGLIRDEPEIVHAAAALIGGLTMRAARARLSTEALAFIKRCQEMPSDDDVDAARAALEALLESFLAEVWAESGPEWEADVQLLIQQLGGGADPTEEAWDKTLHRVHRMSKLVDMDTPSIFLDNEVRLLTEWAGKLSSKVVQVRLVPEGIEVARADGVRAVAPETIQRSVAAVTFVQNSLGLSTD